MSFALQTVQALKACWQLVCRDEDAYDDLDTSMEGFWTSFKAIVYVAPLYLYSSAASQPVADAAASQPDMFTTLSILLLLWVLWPWIMYYVAKLIDREHRYIRYIVAYNWSSVYVIAALVPIVVLQQLGIADMTIASLLSLLVVIWSLYFRWYVAATGLSVSGPTAIGLVAADLGLSVAASLLA